MIYSDYDRHSCPVWIRSPFLSRRLDQLMIPRECSSRHTHHSSTMYSTRNARYLRISSWIVRELPFFVSSLPAHIHAVPLYLYLDERHVGWMSDETLQAVLADLRPK